jgi:hypothetical protein
MPQGSMGVKKCANGMIPYADLPRRLTSRVRSCEGAGQESLPVSHTPLDPAHQSL